jgi:hypothetical protein
MTCSYDEDIPVQSAWKTVTLEILTLHAVSTATDV